MMTAERIKQAVAAVRDERPAYEQLLAFYEKLFLAQEAARANVRLEPIQISEELLSVKGEEEFPLVSAAEFTVDMEISEALLREICRLATTANETLAGAGSKVVEALDRKELDARTLFTEILRPEQTYFDEVSKALDVDRRILAFLAYSSVAPSVLTCAEQLATYLKKDKPWKRGYCPVCGSLPSLAVLRDEGERWLICGFCGHEWKTQRLFCPFCANRDHKTLHYFFSEEEKDYRVDVCKRCNKYIKTVDTREMRHPFYPPVEQVSTLHLDLLAQEQDLESGSPLWHPM